jgi:hypothetical protein
MPRRDPVSARQRARGSRARPPGRALCGELLAAHPELVSQPVQLGPRRAIAPRAICAILDAAQQSLELVAGTAVRGLPRRTTAERLERLVEPASEVIVHQLDLELACLRRAEPRRGLTPWGRGVTARRRPGLERLDGPLAQRGGRTEALVDERDRAVEQGLRHRAAQQRPVGQRERGQAQASGQAGEAALQAHRTLGERSPPLERLRSLDGPLERLADAVLAPHELRRGVELLERDSGIGDRPVSHVG